MSTPADDTLPLPLPGASAALADQLYSHYPDILCLVAPTGAVVRANPALVRATGKALEVLVGTPLLELLVAPDRQQVARALEGLNEAQAGTSVDVIAPLANANGQHQWVAWSFIGGLEGGQILAIGRDISAFKATEEQLRLREEQLERSLSVAGLATWELDLTTLTITLDARMQELLGIPLGKLDQDRLPVDDFIETYTEGKGASTFFLAMLRLARSTTPEYQEQVAINLKTSGGGVVPVWFQLQGMLGSDQRIDMAFGTVLRQQPLAGPGQEADPVAGGQPDDGALLRVLEAGKLATFRVDPEELTLTSSAALNSWLGYPAAHVLDWATFAQAHLGETNAVALSQALSSLTGGAFERRHLQLSLTGGTGQAIEASCSLQKLPGPTPLVEGVLQDITTWHTRLRLLETQVAEATELVEATGVVRLHLSETHAGLSPDAAALFGVEEEDLLDGQLPLETLTERLAGGMDTLVGMLGTLQTGASFAEGIWQLTPPAVPRPVLVRLWPVSESTLEAVAVPLPSDTTLPAAPSNAAVTETDVPDASALEATPAPSGPDAQLVADLLGGAGGAELPEQIVAVCRTLEAQHPGLGVQLWLMDPSGLGSYQVYPEGRVQTGAAGFATLVERLKQGMPLTAATWPGGELPHTHAGAWQAYPLLREELLVGYLWVSAETPAVFETAAWGLLTVTLRVAALLDREALRESSVQQAEVDSERGALGTDLEAARAEANQLKTALKQVETAFAAALPAAVAGRLQGPLSQELPVTVERLATTHRELETELGRLLGELPMLLRRLPEAEGQLAWELLRKALIRRKAQVPAPAELFPQLEIELTGLGVADASGMAEALAKLGWHEGLGNFVVLVKHPDAPVLLAKLAEFHALRTALARTEQLTDRLAERTRTLAVLQQLPSAAEQPTTAVDLAETLESLLPVFAPLYQTGLRLERVYEARPHVEAPAGQVALLCLQLLEGRLRRLPSDSLVRLVIRLEDERARLRLSDEGPVLPLELQQQLSLDATAERPPAALVPLRQAAQLARKLGGTFHVTSNRDGTTLTVGLPLAREGTLSRTDT